MERLYLKLDMTILMETGLKLIRDVVFLGFIYIIYILFKEGLKSQDNSDQII
ncbi:hypothetical protein ACG3JJ_03410 [Streptococcus parauberis]|uniref:hypothetical protein n=1 Tax=Streptococcus parauberis TaxID=1348 RepID=UPI00187C7C31|nr:hypothetical protein [Streptococcus parauberis]UWM90413.1 hypothetical protein N2A94_07895 [Streptococcus parauberis]